MLRMTLTLGAALYASFVIWGQPDDGSASAAVDAAPVIIASGSNFERPTILGTDTPNNTPDVVATRDAVAEDVLPDASAIAASAPAPATATAQPRLIGEPVVVSLVRPAEPAAAPEREEAAADLLRVTGSRVNMRSGPSTSNRVVDALPQGTLAEALGEEVDGWIEIRDIATGQTGFMAARFLEPS